jgi:hypothetical protein
VAEELFVPCYSRDDFIGHARKMKGECEAAGKRVGTSGDALDFIREKAAWAAKAQTWGLVALWLEDLPDFHRVEGNSDG